MLTHICDAMVVSCIDFRLQRSIRRWTDEALAGKSFDMLGFSGGTKDLDTFMEQLDISVRLHHIKQLVLIHHEECGAYGNESTPERHAKDLRKAREAVHAKYPDLQVDLYYLLLNGTFRKIK